MKNIKRLLFCFLILTLLTSCSGMVTKNYLNERFEEYATKQWVENRLSVFQVKIESRGYVTGQEVIELISQLKSVQPIPDGNIEKLLALLEETGANKIRAFTTNTGGASGALDAISCDVPLADYDLGLVFRVSDKTMLFYMYNADGNCEVDTAPYLIAPDDCATCAAGNKGQWELFSSFTFAGVATPSVSFKDSNQSNQIIAKFEADAADADDSRLKAQVEIGGTLTDIWEADGVDETFEIFKPIVASSTYTSTGALRSAIPPTSVSSLPYSIAAADAYGGAFLVTVGSGGATDDTMLPDVCDTATGANVIITIKDPSEQSSIAPTDTGDEIIYEGSGIGAGDELDSPASAEGDFVVLVCLEADKWYVLGHSGTWTDGGAQD